MIAPREWGHPSSGFVKAVSSAPNGSLVLTPETGVSALRPQSHPKKTPTWGGNLKSDTSDLGLTSQTGSSRREARSAFPQEDSSRHETQV